MFPAYLVYAGLAAMVASAYVKAESTAGTIKIGKSEDNLELAQANAAYAQKSLNNIASTQQLLSQQASSASAMGESLGSGSFQAITLDTYQKGKQTDQNLELEKNIQAATSKVKDEQLNEQKDMIPWQFIGDVGSAIVSAYSAAGSPSTGTAAAASSTSTKTAAAAAK